jgi:hypothetical protein
MLEGNSGPVSTYIHRYFNFRPQSPFGNWTLPVIYHNPNPMADLQPKPRREFKANSIIPINTLRAASILHNSSTSHGDLQPLLLMNRRVEALIFGHQMWTPTIPAGPPPEDLNNAAAADLQGATP